MKMQEKTYHNAKKDWGLLRHLPNLNQEGSSIKNVNNESSSSNLTRFRNMYYYLSRISNTS